MSDPVIVAVLGLERFLVVSNVCVVYSQKCVFSGNGDLYFLETKMEKWNWNRDKVSFPKTTALCVCVSHTHVIWAFLSWYKLLFHSVLPWFPISSATASVCLPRASQLKDFFSKGSGVWRLSSIETCVCPLFNGNMTDIERRIGAVWMCHSRAMIILRGTHRAHSVCPFLFCGTIGTLCVLRELSSHNDNYVLSRPCWQFFFLWWEPESQTGRDERADLLHSCRVGWVCEKCSDTLDKFPHICICMSHVWMFVQLIHFSFICTLYSYSAAVFQIIELMPYVHCEHMILLLPANSETKSTVLCPVALPWLLISTSVYLLCCHRNSHLRAYWPTWRSSSRWGSVSAWV